MNILGTQFYKIEDCLCWEVLHENPVSLVKLLNQQVQKSPFVERLLKKGYEVLYLIEPVDEYCIQSLPEFEQKKFQNVAKEGLKIDQSEKAKEYKEQLEKDFEPLIKWLSTEALGDKVCHNGINK